MRISFKRITSSGQFIPEIDGLRFIAITSVFLHHLSHFLFTKNNNTSTLDLSFIQQLFLHGNSGVPIFFVISGFILGLPFARNHIKNEATVNLKKYFLRRLTRLEPPYIIVLTLLLFGAVYVAKVMPFDLALKSYLSSLLYSHNILFFKTIPALNMVTWSLEIEIQFYILAPLIAYLFAIKSAVRRPIVIAVLALLFLIIRHTLSLPFLSIIYFLQYFLAGFLITNLYVTNSLLVPKTKYDTLIGTIFFCVIWLYDKNDFNLSYYRFLWEFVQLVSIFAFCYYVLMHKIFKFLTLKTITAIGGMCYSIYLLHYPILSIFGNPLLNCYFSNNYGINILIYAIILTILVLILSAVFYLLIEQPCMEKDWHLKLFRKIKQKQ